jgi:hypothetical protein
MKIIAETPNDRVLVSLRRDELANILGHYSGHDLKRDFMTESIKSECEIEVSDIYQKHRLISAFQNSGEFEAARTRLNRLMTALTPIESKVTQLIKSGGIQSDKTK